MHLRSTCRTAGEPRSGDGGGAGIDAYGAQVLVRQTRLREYGPRVRNIASSIRLGARSKGSESRTYSHWIVTTMVHVEDCWARPGTVNQLKPFLIACKWCKPLRLIRLQKPPGQRLQVSLTTIRPDLSRSLRPWPHYSRRITPSFPCSETERSYFQRWAKPLPTAAARRGFRPVASG